jgi:hypothetical protein
VIQCDCLRCSAAKFVVEWEEVESDFGWHIRFSKKLKYCRENFYGSPDSLPSAEHKGCTPDTSFCLLSHKFLPNPAKGC